MLTFEIYSLERDLLKEAETSEKLLQEIGLDANDYLARLLERPELWDQEPWQVFNELMGTTAALAGAGALAHRAAGSPGLWQQASGALKGGWGNLGANARARNNQELLDSLKDEQGNVSDEKLAQRGLSRDDVAKIEQAVKQEQGAAKQGVRGGLAQGWSNARLVATQSRLGLGGQQTQPQQAQQTTPQQAPANQSSQPSVQVNPETLGQLQQHLAGLNQTLQSLFGGGAAPAIA